MLAGNDGRKYPTKGHMIYLAPYIMQRSEKYFPSANCFLPERWLETDGAAAAGKAFRPFEHGPRSCAGQELAMIEMQVILALVMRKFDLMDGYAELSSRDSRGGERLNSVEGHGDQAYPIIATTPHPAHSLPMMVRLRTR
jgi:sterigmatocystin biosynthesis cytochrome P450 monooxygenase